MLFEIYKKILKYVNLKNFAVNQNVDVDQKRLTLYFSSLTFMTEIPIIQKPAH